MAEVLLEQVEKRFGEIRAVAGIDLTVRDQEFVILVGPSGCGKTTTLRMIAGLEDVTAGDIRIGGKSIVHLPPRDRDIAMVFQSYALYPHMDVYRNMAFSLQLRGLPKKEIEKRVNEVAEILGLTPQLKRKPRQLSGGQRQRVAVGAALCRQAGVVIFGIRPEHIAVKNGKPEAAAVPSLIEVVEPLGHDVVATARCAAGTFQLNAEIHEKLKAQQQIDLWFDLSRAYLFDKDTECAL